MDKKELKKKIDEGNNAVVELYKKLTWEERERFEELDLNIKYIRKCASAGIALGVRYCIDIEKATNRKIVCEQLRPDIDWGYLSAGSKYEG